MEPTAIRSSSPFEVLALAERTLGFRPRESLVLVSLRPPRWRSGLVARADLTHAAAAVPDLVHHLRADGAGRAFVVVATDAGELPSAPPPGRAPAAFVPVQRSGLRSAPTAEASLPPAGHAVPKVHLPGADVAHLAAQGLREAGVQPELWLVHRGRLHSYTCWRPCCPPEGLPVEEVDSTQVAAEMVLAGRGLAGDREEWEAAQRAAVAPADAAVVAEVADLLEVADRRWRRWERDGWAEPGEEPPVVALELWRGLLEVGRGGLPVGRGGPGGHVGPGPGAQAGPEAAAVLLDALVRVPVRDAVLGSVVPEASLPCPFGCEADDGTGGCPVCPPPVTGRDRTRAEQDDDAATAVRVLQDLARLAPPGRRAAPLGCAAYVQWSRGAAAPAGVLAELALEDDPGHSLSGLVLQSVRLGVPPPSVRQARRAG